MTKTYELDKKGRRVIDRDPDSVLDYSADFTDWLALSTDTIAGVTAVPVGCALAASKPPPSFVGGLVTAWISGGVVGADEMPSVTFRITTAAGRVEDSTIYFKMKDL